MFCFCSSPILGRRFSTAPHSVLISKPAVNASKLSLCSWFRKSQQDGIPLQSSLDQPRTFAPHSICSSIESNTTNLVVCNSTLPVVAAGMGYSSSALSASWCELLPSLCHSMLMLWYQVFLQATKKMSQSQVPLLHEFIPLFNIITHHIGKYIENMANFLAVHATAWQGCEMMDKYYRLTDESILYFIAMSESMFPSKSRSWHVSSVGHHPFPELSPI